MRRKSLIIFLLLAACGLANGQSELPEIGKITDIQAKTKFYIVADGESRKAMIKKIKDTILVVVDRPTDAEFFIEYKTIARDRVTSLQMLLETGQIDVYYYRDKTKVIAWSESKVGGGFKGDTPGAIMNNFVKAYKKRPK